jgi:hypothetical protein
MQVIAKIVFGASKALRSWAAKLAQKGVKNFFTSLYMVWVRSFA